MDGIEEFVDSLGLSQFEGEINGDSYMIEVYSSNDFSKIFNLVSTNDELQADDDSVATVNKTHFVFSDGYYEVELKGDFDKDVYSVVVRER